MGTSAWSNQVVIAALVEIIEGQPGTGLFVYNGPLGLGNPPVLWITNASVDGQGNVVTPGLGLAGLPELVYTGPPGTGDLLLSVSGTGGTDAFGNVYSTGVQVHGTGAFAASNIEITDVGGVPFVLFSTGAAEESIAANAQAILESPGASEFISFFLVGARIITHTAFVFIVMSAPAKDGSVGPSGSLQYNDGTNNHTQLSWGPSGVLVASNFPGDTNNYETERLTLTLASDLVINTTGGQTVFASNIGVGTYEIEGVLSLSATAAAGTPKTFFSLASATATLRVEMVEINEGTPGTFGNVGALTAFSSFFTGATMTGGGRSIQFKGLVVVTVAGAIDLGAATSAIADTFTISHLGSYMNLYPVGG